MAGENSSPIVPTFVANDAPKIKKPEKEAEQKIRILLEKHRLLEEVKELTQDQGPLKKRKI